MFGALGNIAALMKQAQQLGGRVEELTQQLQSQRVLGSAGSGLVEVEVNGMQEVVRVHIDRSLLEASNSDHLEELVQVATNEAIKKARQLHMDTIKSAAGSMDFGAFRDMLNNAGS